MLICSPHQCAYCRSPIASGERWVREKIYEPRSMAAIHAITAITPTSSTDRK